MRRTHGRRREDSRWTSCLIRSAVAMGGTVCGCAGFAAGQATTWTNASGDSLWTDPANWSGGVPGNNSAAIFKSSIASGTVDLGGGSQVARQVSFTGGPTLANGTLTTLDFNNPLSDVQSNFVTLVARAEADLELIGVHQFMPVIGSANGLELSRSTIETAASNFTSLRIAGPTTFQAGATIGATNILVAAHCS